MESTFASAEAVVATEKEVLAKDLVTAIEHAPKDIDQTPERQERQRAILHNLPDHFVEELRGLLYADLLERKLYLEKKWGRKVKNEEVEIRDDRGLVSGAVHEMLVEAEVGLRGVSGVSREILSALQKPETHDTKNSTVVGDALRGRRSPDTAHADVQESGRVVITGTYEAKRHSLNLRGGEQIGPNGVVKSCQILADVLNDASIEELNSWGFPELAQARAKFDGGGKSVEIKAVDERAPVFVTVAEKFHQFVVVPADVYLHSPADIIAAEVGGIDRERLTQLLNNKERVQVRKSAFSTEQENAMVDYALERIYEMEKDNPRFKHEILPAVPAPYL